MLRTRDFYLKKVYDVKGKNLGVIDDITIDFFLGKVLGFTVSNFSLLNKKKFITINNLISMNDHIIVTELEETRGLSFKELKYFDIVTSQGEFLGVLEDFIIDKNDFSIKGLIISSGIFDKIIKGKEVILISQCILTEQFILYKGSENIKLKTLPHGLTEKKNEETKGN